MFVDDAAPIEWRHDRILDEIAGMELAIARDLRDDILEAEDPETKVRLVGDSLDPALIKHRERIIADHFPLPMQF